MRDYILFRFVPTMRCNYRCNYCFLAQDERKGPTMFDRYTPAEWVEGMKKWSDHDVQFYCWGGEPFLLDGTYDVIKGWTSMDHVKSGCRLDTNMHFADKIADRCPSPKIKLNCSWHTQYDTLEEIFRKATRLRQLDMVGMLNFVASPQNLTMLTEKYQLSIQDLIQKFKAAGVFVNIAADFNLVNQPVEGADEGYKRFVQSYVTPEDWRQLRSEKTKSTCLANHHFFTVHHNGDITPCLGRQVCGNFFEGTLQRPPLTVCGEDCPSIVAYPFRMDNAFPIRDHLCEYVSRCASLRSEPARMDTVLLDMESAPVETDCDDAPLESASFCENPDWRDLRIPSFQLKSLPPISLGSGPNRIIVSPGELAGKVAFLARYLQKVLPQNAHNIGLAYPVSPMFLVVLFALLKAGKTARIMAESNSELSGPEWLEFIDKSGGAQALGTVICDKKSNLATLPSPGVDAFVLDWNLETLGSLGGEGDVVAGDCECPESAGGVLSFLEQLCRHAQNPGTPASLEIKINCAARDSDASNMPGAAVGESDACVPLVSVILPVYNHRRLLPLAVDSILAQSLGNFEFIIVNDGSTDGTKEYLDGLTDARIRVVHQENRRLPGALNAGFKLAKGKYCTWVSADNYAAPLFLEALTGALEKHPDAAWAVSAFAWIDERGDIQGVHKDQDLSLSSLLKSNPGIASFLYRRSAAERVGPYNEALEGAEDWDFWLRMAETGKAVYVPEVLYYYRLHSDSLTEKKRGLVQASSRRAIEQFLQRHQEQLDLSVVFPGLNQCADKPLAEFHACLHLGTNLLSSSFSPAALSARLLEQAFNMNPAVEVLVNLCAALVVAEEWETAAQCLEHLDRTPAPQAAPAIAVLRQALERRSGQLARNVGLFRLNPAQSELLQLEKNRQAVYSLTAQ